MLQAYFIAGVTANAVLTTKNFTCIESALSWIVDNLTRVPAATAALNLVVRYQDNTTTAFCDRTLFTQAITLANIKTCP